MQNFSIRPSTEKDFDQIFEIWHQSQKDATGIDIEKNLISLYKDDLERVFSHRNSRFFVAENEHKDVIGWQSLTPLLANPIYGKQIVQSSTYVARSYFNMQVAKSLFRYAYEEIKKAAVEQIYGWVKSDNIAIKEIALPYKYQEIYIPRPVSGAFSDFNLYIITVQK